ncbi:hypothetical protein BDQ12DRAFT_679493 [Crucibulum laeve]|uniref:NOT2/NOT3/NOT5 C-terminal domain-containing protein n=1 Tax=Crucibulum laeve TaxID=68775 RepID=A0A5C3M6G9_9AGAR|nr:hypothetical protein BDQ12DRAFT_679493 [Crucibulum laeve]
MNRPGQPQQRPPTLTPNPGLAGQFRPQYPTGYGIPPRNVNVLQAGGYVPGLQQNSHRTSTQQTQVQSITPQPTPGFIQPRGQGNYAFGGALGQHQQSAALQQQQQLSSQQQQTNGSSNSLPPHLAQTSSLGTAPSVSSTSEVGLDPNDFPALGSTPANNTTTNPSNNGTSATTASYATQAGTGVPIGGTGAGSGAGTIGGGASNGSQTRDFTPDDFPALGGQSQAQGQNQSQNPSSNQDGHSHPPGLNGFQHTDQQQHRQSLLGALSGGLQGAPGMLSLAPSQTRNVHPGFQTQTETEKQQQRNNFSLKLNQASHAAWGSPNLNPTSQSQQQPGGGNTQNGTHPSQNPLTLHPNAPPGVPSPYVQQSAGQAAGTISNANAVAATPTVPYPSNGAAGESHTNPGNPPPNPNPTSSTLNPNQISLPTNLSSQPQLPQTPAQQILMSAADRWGLLSLIAMMKSANTELDHGLTSIGTDLGTMGLDMGYSGNLYSTFITPWADQSAAHIVEPDFHLPACYLSVQAQPPGPAKASAFSDETLFFMFYSSPRDALQEVAAQELWNRNWRYHKDLRFWITKESGTSPSQKISNGNGEQGQYTFWDPENWCKERKEMMVMYADLEEKSVPAFVHGPGLVLAQSVAQTTGQQSAQGLGSQVQQQVPTTQRGSFQMGMAGL